MRYRSVCVHAAALALLYAGVRLHAADPARPRTGDSWKPPLGLDAYMPVPEDNPLSIGKAALGKRLFFDKALSRDRSISCATCHDPAHAFTDDRAAAVGVFGRKGPRRVPKLVNRGYGRSFFWDGRIATLEQQTLQPIQNELEMDLTLDDAVRRLRDSAVYSAEFLKVFRREVHADDLGKALAAYVRTIVSGDSPYDRYMNGNPGALPPEARLGLDIFRGKGNCGACHIGPNLTDESFHNTGVGWEDGDFTDPGRFEVSGDRADLGAFKTPTLREAAAAAPYMHDGSLATLEDVIEHYDKGGEPNPHLDRDMEPLELSEEEKQALLAFLKSLSGKLTDGPATLGAAPQ